MCSTDQLRVDHPAAGRDGAPAVPRRTAQRRVILAALAANPAFVTAQGLHAQLLEGGHGTGLTTVYRALRAFAATGAIDTTRGDDGVALFRHRPEPGHHHYLRCRDCGFSIPIVSDTVEAWTTSVGQRHAFTDTTHTLEVLGICGICAPQPDGDRWPTEP